MDHVWNLDRVTWTTYAQEPMGLLDHLGIQRAFVLGGCMGCSTATAFGAAYPEATLGLLLHWPVGGVRWRNNGVLRTLKEDSLLASHMADILDLGA